MNMHQIELTYLELFGNARRSNGGIDHSTIAGREEAKDPALGLAPEARKVAFILGSTLLSDALRSVDAAHPMLGGIKDHEVVFVRSHEVSSLESDSHLISLAVIEAADDANVLGAVACLHSINPETPVIVVVPDERMLSASMDHVARSGAVKAIVSAGIKADLWTGVLQLVLRGGEYLPAGLARSSEPPLRAADPISAPSPAMAAEGPDPTRIEEDGPADHILTAREREILSLLSVGHQNKIIACELSLSEHTVKVHLQNLYRKLGVHNRTQAVAVGRRLRSLI